MRKIIVRLLEGDKTWFAQRLPVVEDRIRNRLGELDPNLISLRNLS
jgi:glutathione S-transferase